MPLGLVPFLFLVMPIAEISVFILVGNAVGLWPTLGLILLSAVVGTLLVRVQGLGTLKRIQDETRAGRLPGRELADGVMILLAGILLITPGFISDTLGFLLFVPAIRRLAWRFLKDRVTVIAASRTGAWRPGAFAGGRTGAPEAPPRRRPDVVDLGEADFARCPDPTSPWNANGSAAGGAPGSPRLADEAAPSGPKPTLH